MLRRAWLFLNLLCMSTVALAESKGLTLWHSYRGAEEEALRQSVELFKEKSPDLDITLLSIPYEVMASKLTTAIPRGHGPDLFIFAHERVGDWTESGLLEPFELDGTGDEFFDATLSSLQYQERLMGLPLAFKSLALFYNKNVISSAPETTDGIIRLSQLLPDGVYPLLYQADSFYFHAPWFFGSGAKLFNGEPAGGLISDKAKASYDLIYRWRSDGILPSEISASLVTNLFNEDRSALVVNGPWFLGEIAEDVPFGVAPLPIVSATGDRATPFLTAEGIFVSAFSKAKEDSTALASFLAGEESAVIRGELGRQCVAHRGAWERSDLLANDPILGAFRAQVESTIPMNNSPEMRNIWEPTTVALKKILMGGATAEEAAEAAERRYAAITREPPAETSPTAYLVLVAILLSVTLLIGFRWLRGVTRRGEFGELLTGMRWVGPAVLATGVLVFVPFIAALGLSFFSHSNGEYTFVGLGNFRSIVGAEGFGVFQPLSFYFALAVTVLWTLVNIVLHVGIGLGLALLLNNKGLKLKALYRVLLILPWAVPNYITALIWKGLFHRQLGAINGFLELVGMESVSWFSSFWTAFVANVSTNAWLGFPFMMVTCLGALQAIPSDLYDAADLDGANGVQKFAHVTWPLLMPALVPAIMLGIVWTFNQFNIVYLVSGGEPDNATDILISEAYRWAFARREQYGYAAAYSALIFILLLGWSVFSTRFAKRFETR